MPCIDNVLHWRIPVAGAYKAGGSEGIAARCNSLVIGKFRNIGVNCMVLI